MTARGFATRRLTPLAACAAAAVALTSPPIAAEELQEIIVTANKRAENLQEVPISVATVQIEKLQAVFSTGADLIALSGQVPSLYAESTFAKTFPRFYIRGLGNNDFDLNSTQPVGVVYDEVVQENPLLRGFPLFDVQRVEVLRGPQGTLFGRNTPAGTISFISNKPSQKTEAYFTGNYGSDNTLRAEAAAGGALINGVLSARLSVLYERKDDFIDNGFTRQSNALGGFNEAAARLQFLYERGPFTALANAHFRDLDGTARIFQANAIQRGTNKVVSGFSRDRVFQNGQNDLDVSSRGANLKWEYDFGGVTLTSITAYETVDVFTRGDIDGGVAGVGPGFIPFDSETADEIPAHDQWTQEIRLASDPKGRFRWQTGLFYFSEDVTGASYAYGNPADPRGIAFRTLSVQESRTWALFGQVNYDLTPQLTATGGLRYNNDEKDFVVSRFTSGVAGSVNGNAKTDSDRVTWDASLTYRATSDVNLFARIASGYRAPSIQSRPLFYFGNNINRDALSVAKAETILSYEVGVKSDFWDRKARFNLTGFYSDIEDQQFTAVGGQSNNNTLVNAKAGIGYGFEAELELLPVERLLLTAGLSYNHTEIDDPNLRNPGCGAPCTVVDPVDRRGGFNIDGNPFPNAPKWLFSMTARYGIPVSGGELYVFTDWNYRSEVNLFLYEAVEFRSPSKFEGGLKLGYVTSDDRFGVAVFGRNITDEKVIEGAIDFNNLTGIVTDGPLVGVEVSVKF